MESSAYVSRITPSFCFHELKVHYLIHTEWRGAKWLVIASTCGCADLHSCRRSSPLWLGGLARKKRFLFVDICTIFFLRVFFVSFFFFFKMARQKCAQVVQVGFRLCRSLMECNSLAGDAGVGRVVLKMAVGLEWSVNKMHKHTHQAASSEHGI